MRKILDFLFDDDKLELIYLIIFFITEIICLIIFTPLSLTIGILLLLFTIT